MTKQKKKNEKKNAIPLNVVSKLGKNTTAKKASKASRKDFSEDEDSPS